jgi:hypothetical protein
MAATPYYQMILDTLQGQTADLRTVARERLDWAGPGALLDLFRRTSGTERQALIGAIGEVLDAHSASVAVLAQLIHIVSCLDLAEVEPHVRNLQRNGVAAQEPLRAALNNYFAYRHLADSARTAGPVAGHQQKAEKESA